MRRASIRLNARSARAGCSAFIPCHFHMCSATTLPASFCRLGQRSGELQSVIASTECKIRCDGAVMPNALQSVRQTFGPCQQICPLSKPRHCPWFTRRHGWASSTWRWSGRVSWYWCTPLPVVLAVPPYSLRAPSAPSSQPPAARMRWILRAAWARTWSSITSRRIFGAFSTTLMWSLIRSVARPTSIHTKSCRVAHAWWSCCARTLWRWNTRSGCAGSMVSRGT